MGTEKKTVPLLFGNIYGEVIGNATVEQTEDETKLTLVVSHEEHPKLLRMIEDELLGVSLVLRIARRESNG